MLVNPNKLPKEIEIEDSLEEMQKLVHGLIEVCYLLDDKEVVLICNDEGKINNMPLNRFIGYDVIAGPFLILGDDYENAGFKSLTKKQIKYYKGKFNETSFLISKEKIEKRKKEYER